MFASALSETRSGYFRGSGSGGLIGCCGIGDPFSGTWGLRLYLKYGRRTPRTFTWSAQLDGSWRSEGHRRNRRHVVVLEYAIAADAEPADKLVTQPAAGRVLV